VQMLSDFRQGPVEQLFRFELEVRRTESIVDVPIGQR
jgi:hypothetical protein